MNRRTVRRIIPLVLLVGLLPASGCVLASDLLNRDLLLSFGLDPETIVPASGVVLVTLTNNTSTVVEFRVLRADDPDNPAASYDTLDATVLAGETDNKALRCPTGMITLADVGDNDAVDPANAVIVFDAADPTQGTAVAYAGAALREGVDYDCGDIVAYEIHETATGANQAYEITGQVIKGR
jgi:hypothetical protein